MIVLSYRRADSAGYTRAVCERIAQRVGRDHVFLDVDAIEGGTDYRAALAQAIEDADALVLVIGPRWLEERAGVSRLHDPDDVVRFEIKTALEHDVRIVPVLVEGASMPPAAALPEGVRGLSTRNAVAVSNERFDADIDELLAVLEPRRGPGAVVARIALTAVIALALVYTFAAQGWRAFLPGLVAMGALAGAALFAVLRTSALRWVQGGRFLVPGLSVAVFSLIVLGGFTLRERRMASPVTVAVRLMAPDATAAGDFSGEVLLDLPGDARRRPVDANGEAVFAGVPRRLADDSVTVTANVDGYEAAVRRVRIPQDGLIELPLVTRVYSTTVRGSVADAAGRPAAGVTLDFGGLAVTETDASGRFSVVLPVAAGTLIMLRAVRDGETGYNERVTIPAQLPLEVRLREGG